MEVTEIKNLSEVLVLNDKYNFISYETKRLTQPGENFGSLIIAVDISVENKEDKTKKTVNLVAKLCPPNQWIAEVFNIKVTFKKEIAFYNEIVPLLQQLQNEYNQPKIDIFPKCFGARISLNKASDTVDENAVLLLENAKSLGYKTMDCMKGFNLKETQLILCDLAKFHALPIALKIKKPEAFNGIMKHLQRNLNLARMSEDIQQKIFDLMVEVVKNREDTKNLAEDVRKYLNNALKVYKTFSPNEPYATIVHNDYWVNNTMLKFNENGEPIKNFMVDFQIIEYGSPATDLVFFLHSSVQKGVLKESYSDLMKLYHSTFIETLSGFGCDTSAFTFEVLEEEMQFQGRSIEFFHTLMMLRVIHMNKEKLKDFTEFTEEDMIDMSVLHDSYYPALQDTVLEFAQRYW